MKKVENVIANVFQIDENSITDQTSIDNTPSWDSFNGLLLASEVEKEFNITLTTAEIVSVKCVKDIKEILKKKGVII